MHSSACTVHSCVQVVPRHLDYGACHTSTLLLLLLADAAVYSRGWCWPCITASCPCATYNKGAPRALLDPACCSLPANPWLRCYTNRSKSSYCRRAGLTCVPHVTKALGDPWREVAAGPLFPRASMPTDVLVLRRMQGLKRATLACADAALQQHVRWVRLRARVSNVQHRQNTSKSRGGCFVTTVTFCEVATLARVATTCAVTSTGREWCCTRAMQC